MNPGSQVDTALANLYSVWLSVLATLTIQFARTIALSLTISDFLKKIVDEYFTEHITKATPPEYRKWVSFRNFKYAHAVGKKISNINA